MPREGDGLLRVCAGMVYQILLHQHRTSNEPYANISDYPINYFAARFILSSVAGVPLETPSTSGTGR